MSIPNRTFSNIQLRRGTEAIWEANNPILLAGEIGIETNTNKLKIGNGTDAWNSLPYFSGDAGGIALADLSDVDSIVPITGQALVYDGDSWGPAQPTIQAASTAQSGIVELATDDETQTGTDTSRAITPASLSARTATTSRTGVVELATDAETQTGTNTLKAVTPANLSSRTATDSRTGLVELATTAETLGLTDTTRAVTPAVLGRVIGWVPIIPTGGTGSTVDATGLVTLNGASCNIFSIFSADYDWYRCEMDLATSAQEGLIMRLMTAGGSAANTNYEHSQVSNAGGATASASSSTGQAQWVIDGGMSGNLHWGSFELFSPFLASSTRFDGNFSSRRTTGPLSSTAKRGGIHTTSTSYPALRILSSGTATVTGTLRFYGYRGA